MNKFFAAAALALLPVASNAATIDSCDSFNVNLNGGDGAVSVLGFGAFDCAFTITGSDTGSDESVLTTFVAVLPGTQNWLIDFSWNYSTQDTLGSSFDTFGYVIDGVETQLSVDGNVSPAFASGSESLMVAGGSLFGWYIDATDDNFGSADADVFANFSMASVPLPAGAVLMLSGLAGLGLARRRAAKG